MCYTLLHLIYKLKIQVYPNLGQVESFYCQSADYLTFQ